MPRPPKMSILSLKTVVEQLCKPHNMKDERLVSKMEGKTNFSRDLKQFDGLTRLTPTPMILRQICAVGRGRGLL